jgi:hypothetical protein
MLSVNLYNYHQANKKKEKKEMTTTTTTFEIKFFLKKYFRKTLIHLFT